MKKVKGLRKKTLIDTDNSMYGDDQGHRGWGQTQEGEGGEVVTEVDLTWGGEHTIQYTDDVLFNCTPETYIILLANVTPRNVIKK